ncbi:hypothetical protein [Pedobacter xixiisoli]|uniref:Uncharacterized protein n=1 Tax=Pedobacter xixiisoli TaxID=1476464 RepID=A0A285ZZM7_9SPHI|nr:hypothetical protein [Pedobacter xixiisoli]SOD15113.1 hypothetical protein SAMN06297358_2088 [Pedobacter xixiisoli]
MNFNAKHYHINGLDIEWGKPLNEVRPLLKDMEELKPYGGWPNRRGKCSSIFGLGATEFELRAPLEDRPVMQVIYQLAPLASATAGQLHLPYLEQLVKVLGKPFKTEDLYSQVDFNKGYAAGSVVFSAKWEFAGIRISLSVYGGTRYDEDRESAAGIFINWIDEVKAAQPFREQALLFEKTMAAQLDSTVVVQKFKLAIPQRAYRMLDYELKDPYLAEKNQELREAQLALYKKELYPSPAMISSQLQADEIGYYPMPDGRKILVCNQWDAVLLDLDQANEMTYWDILPARGSGFRELLLKELRVEDSRSSLVLLDLMEQIETDTKQQIQKEQALDD